MWQSDESWGWNQQLFQLLIILDYTMPSQFQEAQGDVFKCANNMREREEEILINDKLEPPNIFAFASEIWHKP